MEGFYIDGVRVGGRVALGPMAGVTDMPFRLLCREQGADLAYTEMVSAKGIYYAGLAKNGKGGKNGLDKLCAIDKAERPIALQIFGREPALMAEVAKSIEHIGFDILDINMGCPAPKIVNNGEGCALMKEPDLAAGIIREVSRAIKKPVTVKFRKGFDDGDENAVEFAKMAEESGAAAIAIHGRTRGQYYGGSADWDVIRRAKEAVDIPVIASGDIFTPEYAAECLEKTGCDAVMVARAARGDPWIFKRIKTYLKTGGKIQKPPLGEVLETVLRHGRMLVEFKGEYVGMREMRKHAAWYVAGYKNCAAARQKINEVETYEQLREACAFAYEACRQ